jgi:cyclase
MMLRSRIIPCLLIHKNGLVKTVNFKEPKYVGDPLNAVKIFNEKEVDELIVLDIDASVEKKAPNFELIRNLAAECRMPLCYGGGVTTVEQAKKIIELGAEKVAISSAAIKDPDLIKSIGIEIGVQSVVVVIDVRKKGILFGGGYDIYTMNGKDKARIDLKSFIDYLNKVGVGEIAINSIDNDGIMMGYDLPLIAMLREWTNVPLTAIGGAGRIDDIKELIDRFKIIGASAGSLFVFKGKYKAVLINYPSREEKLKLFKK